MRHSCLCVAGHTTCQCDGLVSARISDAFSNQGPCAAAHLGCAVCRSGCAAQYCPLRMIRLYDMRFFTVVLNVVSHTCIWAGLALLHKPACPHTCSKVITLHCEVWPPTYSILLASSESLCIPDPASLPDRAASLPQRLLCVELACVDHKMAHNFSHPTLSA
jgi:hypothetical protein